MVRVGFEGRRIIESTPDKSEELILIRQQIGHG
jgi:hypothetical protein